MATYASIKYDFTPPTATTSTQVGAGAMTLIKSIDASSDATISFVDGASDVVLDNTYKTYVFKFISVHPASNDITFQWQANASGESGYNETITSTAFRSLHSEDDNTEGLGYLTSQDQANGTSFQNLIDGVGNDNDQTLSGSLHLYNPSSTTYTKHFISRTNKSHHSDYSQEYYMGGYINTTSAIDDIQFKFSSGNIDAGIFNMYGIA